MEYPSHYPIISQNENILDYSNETESLTSPKSIAIKWLQDNFEKDESNSIPRSSVFSLYQHYCLQGSFESFNAASFGKLIRTVFPSLKTRRLGTRGKSKYHYYGIKLKPTSALRLEQVKCTDLDSQNLLVQDSKRKSIQNEMSLPLHESTQLILPEQLTQEIKQLILDAGVIEVSSLPTHLNQKLCSEFLELYIAHSNIFINAIYQADFKTAQQEIIQFYEKFPQRYRPLMNSFEFIGILIEKDKLVWKALAHLILPSILTTIINNPLVIISFFKQLQNILEKSLENFPTQLIELKMKYFNEFLQRFIAEITLNNLAVTFQQIVRNNVLVSDMLHDLINTDFSFLHFSISQSIPEFNTQLIRPFVDELFSGLRERYPIEKWISNYLHLFKQYFSCFSNSQTNLSSPSSSSSNSINTPIIISQFSCYLSFIMNDLTIRNVTSFGSYHILRSLCEEFLWYCFHYSLFDAPELSFENTLPPGASITTQLADISSKSYEPSWDTSNPLEPVSDSYRATIENSLSTQAVNGSQVFYIPAPTNYDWATGFNRSNNSTFMDSANDQKEA